MRRDVHFRRMFGQRIIFLSGCSKPPKRFQKKNTYLQKKIIKSIKNSKSNQLLLVLQICSLKIQGVPAQYDFTQYIPWYSTILNHTKQYEFSGIVRCSAVFPKKKAFLKVLLIYLIFVLLSTIYQQCDSLGAQHLYYQGTPCTLKYMYSIGTEKSFQQSQSTLYNRWENHSLGNEKML